MLKYLTTKQKDRLRPVLLEDQENKCLFCKDRFTPNPANDAMKITFDHLDNNAFNNKRENLALVHKNCNNEKRFNSDYQIIAQEKLKANHSADSLGVSVQANPEPKQTTKEIDINVAMFNITRDFLRERLLNQAKPALDLNDTKHSISYLMKEQTGHGSSETALRHIKDFCSSVGPYQIEQQNGVWIIVKR